MIEGPCKECSFHTDNTPCRINFPYLWKLKEIERWRNANII